MGHVPCDHCDTDGNAVKRCKTCCMFLCEFCSQSHRRAKATKQHRLMTIEEVKAAGPAALTKPSLCSKHKQETLKLFCQTCDYPICRDCIIVDHREHKYAFIEDVFKQQKQVITQSLKQARVQITSLTTAIQSVEKLEKSMETNFAEVNGEIDKFLDDIVAAVERKRNSLKANSRKISQKKIKQLHPQKNDLSLSLGTFQSSVKFAEDVLRKCDNAEILSMKKQITQRFESLCTKRYDCIPCQTNNITLHLNSKTPSVNAFVDNVAVVTETTTEDEAVVQTPSLQNPALATGFQPVLDSHGFISQYEQNPVVTGGLLGNVTSVHNVGSWNAQFIPKSQAPMAFGFQPAGFSGYFNRYPDTNTQLNPEYFK